MSLQDGLTLGQAVCGHANLPGLGLEQLGRHQVNKGQHIVAKAAVHRGHVLKAAPVKVGVKGDGMVQRVGGAVTMVLGDALEQGHWQ